MSTAIFVYAASSPVNGYTGGGLYARLGGRRWIKQMLYSAFLLPSLVCGTAFFINFIAIYYHASRAIPFGTMVSRPVIELLVFKVGVERFKLTTFCKFLLATTCCTTTKLLSSMLYATTATRICPADLGSRLLFTTSFLCCQA